MIALLQYVEHDTFAWWEQVLGWFVCLMIGVWLGILVWRIA